MPKRPDKDKPAAGAETERHPDLADVERALNEAVERLKQQPRRRPERKRPAEPAKKRPRPS